jgi:hypothetical protein
MSGEKRCQFNGKACTQELLSGRGRPRKYCSACEEEARKQNRHKSNAAYYAALKEPKNEGALKHHQAENRFNRRCSYYRLTIRKRRTPRNGGEGQQEYDPCAPYEGYKYALKKLHKILRLVLNPSGKLPSAAARAGKINQKLLEYLEAGQQKDPRNSEIKRFLLAANDLQRDIGQVMSPDAFQNIRTKARFVRTMMREKGEPFGVGHGRFVDIEIVRTMYFAYYDSPNKRQFFRNEALKKLSRAEAFCDMLVKRSTDDRKQMADFLRFYVELVRIRLAFDTEERDSLDSLIEELDKRATNFALAYGREHQIVVTVMFLTALHHAEHQLGLGDFDCSSKYLKEAEAIFKTMQWHSIENQHRLASVKTILALADERSEYEPEECVEHHLHIIERYPCFEYRHGLWTLKDRYDSQVPDSPLLNNEDNSLFVDTTFTDILPFMIPIYVGRYTGSGRCGEEENLQGDESEVRLSA